MQVNVTYKTTTGDGIAGNVIANVTGIDDIGDAFLYINHDAGVFQVAKDIIATIFSKDVTDG